MSEGLNRDAPKESLSNGEARSDQEPKAVKSSTDDEATEQSSSTTSPGQGSYLPRMSAIDEADELSSRSWSGKGATKIALKADGKKRTSRTNGHSKTKNNSRKRRHKSQMLKASMNGSAFGESPKPEGETSSSTHDFFDKSDKSSSSLKFPFISGRRDGSDSSSSSSHSMSYTQKTDSGLLENAKGEKKFINASRVFFAIIGTSAVVVAISAYFLFKAIESTQFQNEFNAQAEQIRLYTQHNLDSAFATMQGLSASTTSIVKRQIAETDWPPGFVTIPDVQHNIGLARNSSNALVIAYMPKVMQGDYDKWIDFSMTQKNWIAEEQPGGPVDIEPIIRPYIWEYTNYDWEGIDDVSVYGWEVSQQTPGKRRQLSPTEFTTSQGDLRGMVQLQESTMLERPVDCSGNRVRRNRFLAKNVHNGRRRMDESSSMGTSSTPAAISQAQPSDEYQTPVWQMSPIPTIDDESAEVQVINYNLVDRTRFFEAVEYMEVSRAPVLLDVCDQSAWFLIDKHRDLLQTVVAFPVFRDFSSNASIVGFFTAIIPWEAFFVSSSGVTTNDVVVVMKNSCGEVFSLSVTNTGAKVIGEYDGHDKKYDNIKVEHPFARNYNREDLVDSQDEICVYNMTLYPTRKFEDSARSTRPLLVSLVIILVFIFTSAAFVMFDFIVTKRQNKLLNTAIKQNAIVNSLFPKNIQRKLMEEVDAQRDASEKRLHAKKGNLNTFLNDNQRGQGRKSDHLNSKPIADLFPNTTIMFADISGFTAWSSAREPEAVFTLLETIYQAFDEIAKRRRVFKVEVVGDCYVAVCGLPDPRRDHYAVMCRFAQDCMAAMHVHTKELEIRLGPDTGDLSLRVGLHSGPVVAGVLRGDKSRFQLFGDTMNTASRMESTGVPNRIQLSQATADLLMTNGKEHWVTKRKDKVSAKGKGELTTYFLLSVRKKSSSTTSASTSKLDEVVTVRSGTPSKGMKTTVKRNRVADWVVEMLGKLLKEMKAKRKLTGIRRDSITTIQELESRSIGMGSGGDYDDTTVIDEVAEYLNLPSFYKGDSASDEPPVSLDKEVIEELQHYVYSIASLYKKNPFHNFEHASHVSMSCIKLLNRIASYDEENLDSTNHHTYGICSDPLTSFAIVFSALIHDVDHCGVPNAQLVKEHAAVATMYKNKSVAEQNSIDIGWGLLMEPTYSNLRRHIYTTVTEYNCFRQIVVNCIMATDICDKDLIKARNKRWDLAFSSKPLMDSDGNENRQISYRKATVVIEHLIQLSDVSHTMQHWHMYRRWNERLFEEGYKAFIEGRAEKDPSENWYQGELGFYDFYIIPLAKKIKQCAVFGVSSDEYLAYALANREEWEERGNEVVKDMVDKVHTLYQTGSNAQVKDSERPELIASGSALLSNKNLKDLEMEASVSNRDTSIASALSGYQANDSEARFGAKSFSEDSDSESSFGV
eukprot:CAMPEP_0116128232 /NCGR_PEP_ID=MMETSP0329-20121206/7251_1 /TAXON_ID=697910 /ORGANISM="Pseudo-nitzschia arenysensis, Strain B593" /LENGTH=1433 /DNA_ID=CAMNT_0003622359 /DNA_START=227 /DNA_END=4528 /DNA_ORIENTATION=-